MASNRIVGIVGPKGSGKSHKAAELFATSVRAVVFAIVRKDTAYLTGATHVIDGSPKQLAIAMGEQNFRIVYRPTNIQINDKDGDVTFPEFRTFIECCFERGDMSAFIDEAHMLCTARKIPARFNQAIILGRHENLDIVYVTQGFSLVSRILTRNTDEFYFWKIIETSDLQGIRERCGEETMVRVMTLRKLEDKRREGGTLTPGECAYWNIWSGLNGHEVRAIQVEETTSDRPPTGSMEARPDDHVLDSEQRQPEGQTS